MIDYFPLPLNGKPERRHLYRWMRDEEVYVHEKFDKDGDGAQREDHDKGMQDYDLEAWWIRQVVQYLDRARDALLAANEADDGVECRYLEMKAQQAMVKGMMTFKGMVESSIRVFGPLPRPGVPSGTVEPWIDPSYPPPSDD